MDTYASVVLAAGKGTRMRSKLPKMLHPLVGRPLLAHVLQAIEAIPSTPTFQTLTGTPLAHPPLIVLGHGKARMEEAFGPRCRYALQEEQLGTGHALLMARETILQFEQRPHTVLVCYGDTPLLKADTLAQMLVTHHNQQATLTLLTSFTKQPGDLGRVLRNESGAVSGVVEVKVATEEQRAIKEVNAGVYCFNNEWLWENIAGLPCSQSGEYYLTDLVEIAFAQQKTIASVEGPFDSTMGVNNRVQLSEAEQILRREIVEKHMYAGVTIQDPASTYIEPDVEIGLDTVILPNTHLLGKTSIGEDCRIGPDTTIINSQIGEHCEIRTSVIEDSTFEPGGWMGPFSHCRQGAYFERDVRIGNFAEIKKSRLGAETDMHHFSYLGDAMVGARTNIAAGVITSNYNGKEKHQTIIEEEAFIGCDTILVAPVRVGTHAYTGAGSVVNRDVLPYTLVVGVPARVLKTLPSEKDVSVEPDTEELK